MSMGSHQGTPLWTCASALAILVRAADTDRFAPQVRLHDRALFELSDLARRGTLAVDTATWRFVPSANGGQALVGLPDVLLFLSEEGWLRRDPLEVNYVVSPEFHEWGAREIATLTPDERRRVRQVARRWKARVSVALKKVA